MPVALGGDEGRDKLRKAAVSGKCAMTRRCPNGETRRERSRHHVIMGRTRGTETSQYPQEEKVNNDCASSGERTRKSPNQSCQGMSGVVGPPTTRKERVAEHGGKRDRSG